MYNYFKNPKRKIRGDLYKSICIINNNLIYLYTSYAYIMFFKIYFIIFILDCTYVYLHITYIEICCILFTQESLWHVLSALSKRIKDVQYVNC